MNGVLVKYTLISTVNFAYLEVQILDQFQRFTRRANQNFFLPGDISDPVQSGVLRTEPPVVPEIASEKAGTCLVGIRQPLNVSPVFTYKVIFPCFGSVCPIKC